MKAILLIFSFLICSLGFAQCPSSGNKNLGSTSFEVNDLIDCPKIIFTQPGGPRIAKEKSVNALTKIKEFLKQHPTMVVEVRVHSGVMGSESMNMKITEMRAKSIVNYLVNECYISKERLKVKGLGESNPLIPKSRYDNAVSSAEKTKFENCNNRIVLKVISL